MGLPRRQRDQQPPAAQPLTCPSCGEDSLGPHCDLLDTARPARCRWLLCANPQCRSYGVPGRRWCDLRKKESRSA